jgi:proteasome lid subunit RPN8/RPN11
MDYQELGADLADTFSEHDRPPNDDNSKEETDDDSHTEEQANSTTKSAKCMNLLGQGRKDLARLRRLSSISAENISHPNESRADEGATTNHDTSDNEQSETVDESKLVGDENAPPTNVTDSADIDLKHAEVNEGPVNDLEATDDGLDKTMGENTGVNDDAPSQKSKVESEVINEILQPKISAGEKVMLLKDEDIIVPDDDASSKELVRKREKQDIIAINDDAPSQKLKAEPLVINEIPAHEQKSLAVEEVTILKDDSRCETPSKELTSGRKLRRDHPIIVTSKIAAKKKTRSTKQVEIPSPSDFCKVVPLPNRKSQLEYPHAPMGSIWLNQSLRAEKSSTDTIDLQAGGTLVGRRWVWDEGYFVDARFNHSLNPKNLPLPGCNCGANHEAAVQLKRRNSSSISDSTNGARARRSERSGTSTRMTSVLNQLASGTLSPHTLISCEEYVHGPEYRFQDSLPLEDVQPFSVRVSPDATFLADLHAHLCEAEIIGFLGGHYSAEERCLYIQAAFPCKSTDRQDSGQTDVEMDPVSQIYAKEAIDTHDMSVVGWYHSHPTFQPDPSVTDIENQANCEL